MLLLKILIFLFETRIFLQTSKFTKEYETETLILDQSPIQRTQFIS